MSPWTEIASVVALGVGANTENLPVGLAYGFRGLRIGLLRNLLIAGITTAATVVPLTAGRGVRGLVAMVAPDVVGGLLLVGLGLFNVWQERRRSHRSTLTRKPGGRGDKNIGLRETFTLAGALSLNNIGLGFAGGIAGLGEGPVALSVSSFSVLLLWLGEWLSRRIASPSGNAFGWLKLDGNLLLIGVGILMMLGA